MSEGKTRESWAPTIKWVAIAVTVCVLAAFAYKAYRVATAPVRAAQDMSENMSAATEAAKDKASDMINRLEVDASDAERLNVLSEAAFVTLTEMPETKPATINDRVFRAAHLRDNGGKVCKLSMDFGNGDIPVFVAANNKTYATAKALGSKEDRIIRVHIVTADDDVAIRSYWDMETKAWSLRWRRATMGKPISDAVAEARLMDILAEVPDGCGLPEIKLPELGTE